MAAQVPGIYHITNNQTGLYLDLAGFSPTGVIWTWTLNNPATGNQQWNVSYFNPTNGSGNGYIVTAVDPKSHIGASDDVGAQVKGDLTNQKIWYIHRANNCSDIFLFSNQDCAEGLVWEAHGHGVALTMEHLNASHGEQFWKMTHID